MGGKAPRELADPLRRSASSRSRRGGCARVPARPARTIRRRRRDRGARAERAPQIARAGSGRCSTLAAGRAACSRMSPSGARTRRGCDVDATRSRGRPTTTRRSMDRSRSEPPLPFATESFDLVYSISVFSHLDEQLGDAWLAEVARVFVPGGVALLSVHGAHAFEQFRTGAVTTAWCPRRVFDRGPLGAGEFVFEPYVRRSGIAAISRGSAASTGSRSTDRSMSAIALVEQPLEVLEVRPRAITAWQDLVVCQRPSVDTARSLAPKAASLAAAGERARRLDPGLVSEIAAAGLFRLCVPAAIGGLEAPVADARRSGRGARAWRRRSRVVRGGQRATSGLVAAYLPEAAAREIYGSPDRSSGACSRLAGAPHARMAPSRHGRWPFASGCHHCGWLMDGAWWPAPTVSSKARRQRDARCPADARASRFLHDPRHVGGRGAARHRLR